MIGRSAVFAPPHYFAIVRWLSSPYINHFLSADTVVPGYANPQSLNRYSYTLNNPLRYTDPSGRKPCEEYAGTCLSENQVTQTWNKPKHNTHHHNNNQDGGGPLTPVIPPGPCSGPDCPIDSDFPSGPSCILVSYCYIPAESPEPYPWLPDYVALDGGLPVVWILGVDVVFTADKYNRVYLGVGPGVGSSPAYALKVNGSLSVGYIQDDNTTPEEAHSFISKWSGTGCIGFVIGGCGANGDPLGGDIHNRKDWAVQVGAFTPQFNVALPYSWQIYP